MPQSGGNATKFQDLTIHPSDGGYMLFCIIFIHLGSAGVFLNWRAFYSFFHLQTVRNDFDTPKLININSVKGKYFMLYFANFTYRSKIESTLLCSTSSSATFLFRPLVYLSTLLVCCKRLAHRWEEDNQNSYFVNLKDFFTWQVVIIDLFISVCITLI